MIVFRYDLAAPFLSWATIGADGTVTQPPIAVDGVDEGYMIHDFSITARYVVLIVSPLLFDFGAIATTGTPLAWKPELGTRIAIIPRDRQSPTRWVHADAFWAWHYGNAFDDGENVQLDFCMTTAPGLVLSEAERRGVVGGFSRATLDPARGTLDLQRLDSNITEFPRVDDRLTGLQHRYVTIAGRSDNPALIPGEHDVLHRYDMVEGTSVSHRTNACIGEVVFAPRDGATGELDGYYLAFGTDVDTDVSAMYIWDAGDFPSDPVAVIPVPQRIPNGLHGNWFPTLA
jgi:carotenoid cleavage dioxygenase